jgi:hypothetical protein
MVTIPERLLISAQDDLVGGTTWQLGERPKFVVNGAPQALATAVIRRVDASTTRQHDVASTDAVALYPDVEWPWRRRAERMLLRIVVEDLYRCHGQEEVQDWQRHPSSQPLVKMMMRILIPVKITFFRSLAENNRRRL